MNSMRCEAAPHWGRGEIDEIPGVCPRQSTWSSRRGVIACLSVMLGLLLVPAQATAATQEGEDAASVQEEDDQGEGQLDEGLTEPGRRAIEELSQQELEDQGFVFESTITQRERAHATVFAMTAGAVVPGAGHWHLDDSRTALALVATEISALALLSTGAFLSLSPTGRPAIDDRRREMFFLGTGLLGTRRIVDIVGTAYRDELGIPRSTSRRVGWGVQAGYEYLRPPDLSMRHLSSVGGVFRTRHMSLEAGTAQELGWGMSDYHAEGRWFPLVGTDPTNRFGVGLRGRFLHYRLDEPFQRADAAFFVEGAFNMGRLFTHLDQMEGGMLVGYGVEGRRRIDDEQDDQWTPLTQEATLIPMRMYLAFNFIDPLRLEVSLQRGMRHWLEPVPSRIGVPSLDVTYRSADRLDLLFSSIFGTGTGVGAGLRFWFGE